MNGLNPTGGPIRTGPDGDRWGDGLFGASRGRTTAGAPLRQHRGVDFVGMPGQWVVAPVAGVVTGLGRPYGDMGPWDRYIRLKVDDLILWRLFYVIPLPSLVGRKVRRGEIIGRLADVSEKYGTAPGKGRMRPHCHTERIINRQHTDPGPLGFLT